MTFFRSRWAPEPAHVRDLGPEAGLPAGFRAAGVACGIKPSGTPDLGLLVCDSPKPVSAARFADTGTPAAPVLLSQERCALSALRVVLANSGCANAATGRRGLEDAAATQQAAAAAVGAQPHEVILGSTGGISQYLPVERVLSGIEEAAARLDRAGDAGFQQAIQTTDRFEKRACLEAALPSGTVRLTAQCKGAGMISPRFATMLCFVQTDAAMAPETADLLLGVCVKRSFDRCTVDGQLSTNDTAVLMCSGASGVRVEAESEDERLFGEALDALLRQLAISMVADGEGAARIARVVVRGGHALGGHALGGHAQGGRALGGHALGGHALGGRALGGHAQGGRALGGHAQGGHGLGGHGLGGHADPVEAVARAVANSPLVKAALHGKDPNWGRIVQAAGAALPGTAPLPIDISIEGIQVCSAGVAVLSDEEAERQLAQRLERVEVEYEITLPGEGAETEVFFSDLSHEYVTINADYTT